MSFSFHYPSQDYSATGGYHLSLCLSPLTLPHRITLLLTDITLSFSSHSLTGLLCYWQISLCLSPLTLPHRITLLLTDITLSFSSHSPSQDYSATDRYHFVFLLSLSLTALLCRYHFVFLISLSHRITLLLTDITLSFSSHSPSQDYSATDRYHFVFLLSLSLTGLLCRYHFVFLLSLSLTGLLCYWQISLCLSPLTLPHRITLLLTDITLSFSSHSPSQDYSADITLSFSSHSPSQDYSATGRYHFVFLISLSLAGLLCYWQISLCLSPLTLPHRITLPLADITLSFSSHSPSQDYSATDRYHFVFLLSLSLAGLLCYWQISLCLSPLTLPHRITLLLADITLSFSSHSQDYSATGRYHFVFLLSLFLTGLLCYWQISLCLSALTLPHRITLQISLCLSPLTLSHRITLLLADITLSFSSHSLSQDYSATGRYHFVFLLSLSLTGLLCYWQISLCLALLTLPCRITLLLVDIALSFSSHSPSQDYSDPGRYRFVFLLSLSLAGLLCYW